MTRPPSQTFCNNSSIGASSVTLLNVIEEDFLLKGMPFGTAIIPAARGRALSAEKLDKCADFPQYLRWLCRQNPMEQPPSLPEVQSAAPKTPAMSVAARMLNIFAAPGEVFDDIKNSPALTSSWLVPAVVLVVVGWICSAIVLSQMRFGIRSLTW